MEKCGTKSFLGKIVNNIWAGRNDSGQNTVTANA
jgi:hypothetical protein